MAFVDIVRMKDPQDYHVNRFNQRVAVMQFSVYATDAENAISMLASAIWPLTIQIGMPYRKPASVSSQDVVDPLCAAQDMAIETRSPGNSQTGARGHYVVTVYCAHPEGRYTLEEVQGGATSLWYTTSQELLTEPADHAWRSVDGTTWSANPVAFAPSAGEPFEEGALVRTVRIKVLTIKWSKIFHNFSEADAYADPYRNMLNSQTFWGGPKRCVECTDITVEPQLYYGVGQYYFRFVGTFKYKAPFTVTLGANTYTCPGYAALMLDKGYCQVDGADVDGYPKITVFKDPDGTTYVRPAYLDGAGKKLKAAQVAAGSYVARAWCTTPIIDLNELQIA